MILFADSKGPDQTAQLRRLIWDVAVSVCTALKVHIHMACQIDTLYTFVSYPTYHSEKSSTTPVVTKWLGAVAAAGSGSKPVFDQQS